MMKKSKKPKRMSSGGAVSQPKPIVRPGIEYLPGVNPEHLYFKSRASRALSSSAGDQSTGNPLLDLAASAGSQNLGASSIPGGGAQNFEIYGGGDGGPGDGGAGADAGASDGGGGNSDGVDGDNYAKGGAVKAKKMAKGGAVQPKMGRGDGCATRGKTKGRMV